jgi:hypothetical protein
MTGRKAQLSLTDSSRETLADEMVRRLEPIVDSAVEKAVGPVREDVARLHGRLDGIVESGALKSRRIQPAANTTTRTDWKGIAAVLVACASVVGILWGVISGAKPSAAPTITAEHPTGR